MDDKKYKKSIFLFYNDDAVEKHLNTYQHVKTKLSECYQRTVNMLTVNHYQPLEIHSTISSSSYTDKFPACEIHLTHELSSKSDFHVKIFVWNSCNFTWNVVFTRISHAYFYMQFTWNIPSKIHLKHAYLVKFTWNSSKLH